VSSELQARRLALDRQGGKCIWGKGTIAGRVWELDLLVFERYSVLKAG